MMDHLAALAKIERMEAQLDRLRASHDRLFTAAKDVLEHLEDVHANVGGHPVLEYSIGTLLAAIATAEKLTP